MLKHLHYTATINEQPIHKILQALDSSFDEIKIIKDEETYRIVKK